MLVSPLGPACRCCPSRLGSSPRPASQPASEALCPQPTAHKFRAAPVLLAPASFLPSAAASTLCCCRSTLLNNKDPVGSVTWSGVVVKHELCGDCRDYKTAGPHHIVKVNYETVL